MWTDKGIDGRVSEMGGLERRQAYTLDKCLNIVFGLAPLKLSVSEYSKFRILIKEHEQRYFDHLDSGPDHSPGQL